MPEDLFGHWQRVISNPTFRTLVDVETEERSSEHTVTITTQKNYIEAGKQQVTVFGLKSVKEKLRRLQKQEETFLHLFTAGTSTATVVASLIDYFDYGTRNSHHRLIEKKTLIKHKKT